MMFKEILKLFPKIEETLSVLFLSTFRIRKFCYSLATIEDKKRRSVSLSYLTISVAIVVFLQRARSYLSKGTLPSLSTSVVRPLVLISSLAICLHLGLKLARVKNAIFSKSIDVSIITFAATLLSGFILICTGGLILTIFSSPMDCAMFDQACWSMRQQTDTPITRFMDDYDIYMILGLCLFIIISYILRLWWSIRGAYGGTRLQALIAASAYFVFSAVIILPVGVLTYPTWGRGQVANLFSMNLDTDEEITAKFDKQKQDVRDRAAKERAEGPTIWDTGCSHDCIKDETQQELDDRVSKEMLANIAEIDKTEQQEISRQSFAEYAASTFFVLIGAKPTVDSDSTASS